MDPEMWVFHTRMAPDLNVCKIMLNVNIDVNDFVSMHKNKRIDF